MNLCVVDGTPGMTMPEAHEKALELAQEEPGGDFIYYPVRMGVGMASKVEEVHRTVKTEFLGVEA